MDYLRRRLLRLLPVLLLSILAYIYATIAYAPVAFAHAYVIGSDPVDGSTISAVPAVVRIFFNTPISAGSLAHIYDTQNNQFVEVATAGSFVAPTNPRELDIPLLAPNSLPEGGYFVRWVAIANDDGHTTYGSIGFNVGFSSTGLAGVPKLGPSTSNNVSDIQALDPISLLGVAWEWLGLIALTFWGGLLVAERLITGETERASSLFQRARKRGLPLQWLCLSTLLVSQVVTLILRATRLTHALNGNAFDLSALRQLILETDYGHLWLVRLVLIGIALGLLWQTRQPHPDLRAKKTTLSIATETGGEKIGGDVPGLKMAGGSMVGVDVAGTSSATLLRTTHTDADNMAALTPTNTIAWLLLASLILLTMAISGDAAQIAPFHISAILFEWLLLAAQCIWFGGLAYLGYVLLPVSEIDAHAEMFAAFLRRLTPFIIGAISVFLVSTLFLSEITVNNAQQLLLDPYGRTLLVRLLLIAVLLLLSIYAIWRAHPKLTRQAALLPVVDVELPARRARHSALEQTARSLTKLTSMFSFFAAAVLISTALMSFYAPPIVFPNITYTNPPIQNAAGNGQTKQVGDISITLQVLPGKIGVSNIIIVLLTDGKGNPITDAQVQLSTNMIAMDMGTAHATIDKGSPVYVATFNKAEAFSMAGVWNIEVSVQRTDQAGVQAAFQVTVAG